MIKQFFNLIIGDLEGKGEYRKLMKRIKALPKDYQYTFKKIKKYMYVNGLQDEVIFYDLVELFEDSAVNNKEILDVIGKDVSKFADEMLMVGRNYVDSSREQLNMEIHNTFKEKSDGLDNKENDGR